MKKSNYDIVLNVEYALIQWNLVIQRTDITKTL